MSSRLFLSALCLTLAATACARSRSGPLPGDSVAEDGGIGLSPPRMSTSPRDTQATREPLGAVESRLFPPELVMDHQGELGIDTAQRDAILREVQKGQTDMLRLQWDLQGEKEKLVKVLDGEHVDERASADAAARVMERETRVKASHLAMLVRVKNLLTGAQQQKLRDLREGAPSLTDAGVSITGKVDAEAPKDAGGRK